MATVTLDGTVKTVTITPTSVPNSPSSSDISADHGGGLSTGAAVGIAIVVFAVVAAIIAALACLYIRRRRKQRAEDEVDAANVPSQRASSAGMTGTTKAGEMSENRYGSASDGVQAWDDGAQRKRRSHLMPVDPRMDAFNKGIYNRAENKSHESFNSLRDDQDYSRRVHEPSRVLRMTNPDPSD
jgi:cell wall integrity and stress response component